MLVKSFFAFDQTNNVRFTPVKLSEMFALKSQDNNRGSF